jgi:hypothetical protein
MEPHIPYDYLIQVMDIVRSIPVAVEVDPEAEYEAKYDAELEGAELLENTVQLVALFPEISVGDAP